MHRFPSRVPRAGARPLLRTARWRLMVIPLLVLPALQCTDSTGVDSLGQLRIRPVFADGQDPTTLGISVQSIHLVLRRDGGAGSVVVDTTLPYEPGSTTSWLLDLQNPPEQLGVAGELSQGATTFYTGDAQASVMAGIGSSSSSSDLPMQYIGRNTSFSIDVTPDSAELGPVGATQSFSAEARDSDGNPLSGFSYTWTSSAPTVATVDSASGLATAVGPGQSIITATAGNVADSAVLIVQGTVISLEVSPTSATVAEGDTQQYTAVARDAQGNVVPGVDVSWRSDSLAIATVSADGLATGVSTGAVSIIASIGSVVADTAQLAVLGPDVAVAVTPDTAAVGTGSTQQFVAAATDGNGNVLPGVAFTWSSSNPVIATVDTTGLATGVSSGVDTITATAAGRPGMATLHVLQGVGGPGTSIVVTPPTATITALGGVQQYTAAALDAQGQVVPGVQFTWSSANPAVGTIDPSGLATGRSVGQTTIAASVGSDTGFAILNVLSGSTGLPVRIVVTPAAVPCATLASSEQFSAVAYDAQGRVVAGVSFAWSSSSMGIATVDATGLATNLSPGTTTISASAFGVTGSATLQVCPGTVGPPVRVLVTPGIATLTALRDTTRFTAIALDAVGHVVPGVQVSWNSSDAGNATVDAMGLATEMAAPGVVRITATTGTVSGGAFLYVTQTVASVVVTPPAASIAEGSTATFSAVAYDANGFVIPGAPVLWSTSDPAKATVDGMGNATGISAGTVTVTARSGHQVATASLTVIGVGSIEVHPAGETIVKMGAMPQYTAVVYDMAGNVIPGAAVVWSSSDPGMATIDPATGVVTALRAGTVRITANAGHVSAHAWLVVQSPAEEIEDRTP